MLPPPAGKDLAKRRRIDEKPAAMARQTVKSFECGPSDHFQLPCLNRSDGRRLSYGLTNEIGFKEVASVGGILVHCSDRTHWRAFQSHAGRFWPNDTNPVAERPLITPEAFALLREARIAENAGWSLRGSGGRASRCIRNDADGEQAWLSCRGGPGRHDAGRV